MHLKYTVEVLVLIQFFFFSVLHASNDEGRGTPNIVLEPKSLHQQNQEQDASGNGGSKTKQESYQADSNRKAYVTLITSDKDVDKTLVMLASLFAMTRTKETLSNGTSGTSSKKTIENESSQCTLEGNFNFKCDYYKHNHDYLCLVIPKENNPSFESDKLLNHL